jgi:signal transduction histidine kinase
MDALKLNPWAALVQPNVARLSWLMLGYLAWSSCFLFGLEQASGLPAMQIGLLPTALGTAIMALPCLPVIVLTWYSFVRPRWLRDPALRARIEHHGMYAALPWWAWFALNMSVTLAVTCLTHPLWIQVMTHFGLWGHADPGFYRLPNSLTLGGFAQAITLVFDMNFVRQRQARIRAEVSQRQLAQAQLQRLQAQLEPHMLFNTLANLHALIEAHPARAQDMLAHLIDYLRATLGASRSGHFTLAEEMKLVQDYLALMQIRMGERLQVQLDMPASLGALNWPPMLLQPLVENAIQHGLDPLPQGGSLHIAACLQGEQLCVRIRDDGVGLLDTPAGTQGFGVACVRERLHTLHGDQASLTLAPQQPRGTLVTLLLPVSSTPAVAVVATPASRWRLSRT